MPAPVPYTTADSDGVNNRNSIIDELHAEKEQLQQRVWELEEQNGFQHFKVTVTMYNPTRKQCDSTPNITADGTKINPKKASEYRLSLIHI